MAAEIFEDALIPFLGKILSNLSKKLRDETQQKLHNVIADSIGLLQWHILTNLDQDEQMHCFEKYFESFPFQIFDKTRNKAVQQGAIACLTKIMLNCPDELLFEKLDELCDRMIGLTRLKHFQAH